MIRKKYKFVNISVLVFVICIGGMLIVKKTQVADEVSRSLAVCGEVLIPSIFPFMMLSSFAIKSGVFGSINRISAPFMKKIFGLPAECFSCLFFGFIGGYPVGASIVSELYEKKKITEKDARHIFSFCVNAGPAFVVTAAGEMMLRSETAGVVMLVSVCFASVITGVVFSLFKRKTDYERIITSEKNNLSQALVDSAFASSKGIISVCTWVLIFSAFSGLMQSFIKNETLLLVYLAFSEVTTGIGSAAKLGGIPLVSAVISFGGICVMCQILPIIKKCGVKASEYLAFRIVNAVLSFFTAKIILLFIDVPINVFADTEMHLWSHTAPSSAILLIMCAVLIFDITSGQIKKLKIYDITG
ncbi:MAG: hypothetical protein IKM66_02135 [Clostridia bacterium]|nr:hypothetical protein [Clostridia bacterium]